MTPFATLLDRLTYTPSRLGKLTLMRHHFQTGPDPERGLALAALTDGLDISFPVRRVIGELAEGRFDPELFRLSRDYVGDTAETLALIWPARDAPDPPQLSEVVAALATLPRARYAEALAGWLDRLDAVGRWALLKFLGGTLRVGVSARLAKTALAEAFGRPVEDIEEKWHGQVPPYTELFDWLEGRRAHLPVSEAPVFKPLMLAVPLEAADFDALAMADFAAEWKWDGIRVQMAGGRGETRIFSRGAEDITASFPDIAHAFPHRATVDGELLVLRGTDIAPFADLQQRLNRKSPSAAMMQKYPAHVRLYDALELDGEDLRALPFTERRARLDAWFARVRPHHCDLSPLLSFASKEDLRAAWQGTRDEGIEGLMLKRRDSPYLAGRPKGHWFKWKRAALTADCVLLYAQRGSGKRSSYYSDYTFACWQGDGDARHLVPVGKAYSGFTDEELMRLDRFVRAHTIERFGPVRSVEPRLVLEVAFDGIQKSSRHKSGIAMRFPRIARIRWDKPAGEADEVETLRRMITS